MLETSQDTRSMKTQKHVHHGTLGEDVQDAASDAIERFSRMRDKIGRYQGRRQLAAHRFAVSFNGIEIAVLPGETRIDIMDSFHAQTTAREEAYRKSPERVAEAAQRESRLQKAQTEMTVLMAGLDSIVKAPMPELIEWVSRFMKVGGFHGIDYDRSRLLGRFNEEGYRENAFVGEHYKEQVKTDPEAMGRYIIGQFINLVVLERGFPDLLEMFVDRYRNVVLELG
jgi:hypothetical protein